MKKVIAWLLVLALTAAVSIGATLAYLTDTDEDVNVMTLGQVKIDQLEYERVDSETADEDALVQEFHDNKPMYPAVTDGDWSTDDAYVNWDQIGKEDYTSGIWDPEHINNEVDKMVFVKNKGDYDAYVRSVFAFEAGNYTTLEEFQSMVHLNLNDTDWTWQWADEPVTIGESTYFVATATYDKVLAPGQFTEISLGQLALDPTATNEDVAAFGDTYQVLVKSQAVQAAGFEAPDLALDEAFGEIIVNAGTEEAPELSVTENLPFENDDPISGIGLKQAVRYINGDKSLDSRNLTKNVIIDDISKYPQITENYKPVLVDVLQDVPAYAYYVPNGNYYDVYVLSSDKVYADSCYTLFYKWSELETVYCPTLDTSRAENRFSYMFGYGSKLKSVTPTNWDTAHATTTYAMFAECAALEELDASTWTFPEATQTDMMFLRCKNLTTLGDTGNWNLSATTTMASMFEGCEKLTELDATNWDCSSVTTMFNAFAWCESLKTLEGTENWNLSNVTNMCQTFAYNYKLADLDVSTWNTPKCTDMSFLFKGCRSLTELDVANWDVSKVTVFNSMFSGDGQNADDMNLKNLDLSRWNTESAQRMNHMFYGCAKLETLDLSGWDVSNVVTTSHMFADCTSLSSIDFTGWETTSLVAMDAMFNECYSLTVLDMSSFDTSKVMEFSQMFEYCTGLKEVIGINTWNTAKGGTFSEMFSGCSAMEVLDLSSFDTSGAYDNYQHQYTQGVDYSTAFGNMLSGMTGLHTLILSDDIHFDGNGTVPESNWIKLPSPAPIDGVATQWYNAETDTYYNASQIPEGAATYVAAIPTT